MSRLDKIRLRNIEKELFHGLFNAKIKKIKGNVIYLEDIVTKYEFNISFNLSEKLVVTKSNKPIWINQLGEVGYGEEEFLLNSFLYFPKTTNKKQYWRARQGEVHLMNFLKAYSPVNPFDKNSYICNNNMYISDSDSFKKLFKNDSESERTVGGIIYVSEDFEEKVLNLYFPGYKKSIIKNCKGNFHLIEDFELKQLKNLFTNHYNPKGYYLYDNISEFILK